MGTIKQITEDQEFMKDSIERRIEKERNATCSKSRHGKHSIYEPDIKSDEIKYWESYCIYCSEPMIFSIRSKNE